MVQALTEIKTGKASGPAEVSLKLVASRWEVRIQVMVEIR